jgi:20S proteasome alpha/beta subunit
MTVAIAIPCSDGIVLAADSMGHAERIATKVQKISVVGPHQIAVATSGSEFMTQALLDAVENQGSLVQLTDMVRGLGEAISAARQVPIPPANGSASPHGIEALFAFWSGPGSSVVHLPDDLACVECIDKPFVAAGSAADFANVVFETLSHLVDARPTLSQGKLLAYRIVSTVCQVSSWGVGLPVQMSTVTEQGAEIVPSTELEQLNAEVARWLAVESTYLIEAAGGGDVAPVSGGDQLVVSGDGSSHLEAG